jgi:hypothetical protein
MRMLDLFCGRLGWSKAFLARGWDVTAIDLIEPPEVPRPSVFMKDDVMNVEALWCSQFDFICASSPCEEFSVHGMKHFHPNPKYPENGIRLFNHTREICEASGVPYVMENVRAAQQFVGRAVHHCGPFYLWGTGVPAILPQGIVKGTRITPGNIVQKALDKGDTAAVRAIRRQQQREFSARAGGASKAPALSATIPPELANCVADYAERLLLTTTAVAGSSGQTDPVDRNSGDAS